MKRTTTKFMQKQQGFSLIEILVALFLMAMVFMLAGNVNFSYRAELDDTLSKFETALRMGVNEAAIKNRIVRLHINLIEDPQQWSLEYGPDEDFILPEKRLDVGGELSDREREEFGQEAKEVNKSFNRISEFSDGPRKLDEDIRVIGVGTTYTDNLITEFYASLYIYPTGEKDGGIIIVASPDEVVSLEIEAFTNRFRRTYKILPEGQGREDLYERQLTAAEELYNQWLSKS